MCSLCCPAFPAPTYVSMFGKENSSGYESRETAKLNWNMVEEPFTVEVGVSYFVPL